jgi:Hint module
VYAAYTIGVCIATGKTSIKYLSYNDDVLPPAVTYASYATASNCTGANTTTTNSFTCSNGGLYEYGYKTSLPSIKTGFKVTYYNNSGCTPSSAISYYFDPKNVISCKVNYERVCSAADVNIPLQGAFTVQNCFDVPANVGDCFAGSETLLTESGAVVSMENIKIGDRILSADKSRDIKYATVIAIPHAKNNIRSSFLNVQFNGGSLKLTAEHVLFASAGCTAESTLQKASLLTIKDCLLTTSGLQAIESITSSISNGVYSVVTTEEYIIVNGVIASPFAANHLVANSFYGIYRTIFRFMPSLLTHPLISSFPDLIGGLIMTNAIF